MKKIIFTLLLLGLLANVALAEWKPSGPIKLWIGFGAGGGTDIQARTLAGELEERQGWRIIPDNKSGGGGTVMAALLKDAPADGQTLGLAITTTFDFAPIDNENIKIEDFTYITTTAASQMAVLARADSGWKSLEDMVAAAKSGTKIVWANSDKLKQLGSEIVARNYGIGVNHLRGSGGKAGINALVAQDANVAWAGGSQRGLVEAGELVILASGEEKPLVQAPDGKTLYDYGIPYTIGFKFILVGPKGMSNEVRDGIANAVSNILKDPESKTYQFIAKQYPPGPDVLMGDELAAKLKTNLEANMKLVEEASK